MPQSAPHVTHELKTSEATRQPQLAPTASFVAKVAEHEVCLLWQAMNHESGKEEGNFLAEDWSSKPLLPFVKETDLK